MIAFMQYFPKIALNFQCNWLKVLLTFFFLTYGSDTGFYITSNDWLWSILLDRSDFITWSDQTTIKTIRINSILLDLCHKLQYKTLLTWNTIEERSSSSLSSGWVSCTALSCSRNICWPEGKTSSSSMSRPTRPVTGSSAGCDGGTDKSVANCF